MTHYKCRHPLTLLFLYLYKEVLCGIIVHFLCMRHQKNSIDYDRLNLRVETFK